MPIIKNPFRAYRNAREAFRLINTARKRRKSGKEHVMQIDLGTRTSTNTLVGGGILSSLYVQAVGFIPYDGLVSALTTPEAIALAATFFAWVVARISKTPAAPGKI